MMKKTPSLILFISLFAFSAPVPKQPKLVIPLDKCLNDCPNVDRGKEPVCAAKCMADSACKNDCCLYETETMVVDGKADAPKTKLVFDGCSEAKKSVCFPGPDQAPLPAVAAPQQIPRQMPAREEAVTYQKKYEITEGPCDSTEIPKCTVSYDIEHPENHAAIVDAICANLGITVHKEYPVVGNDCVVECKDGRNVNTIEKEKISFPFSMCRPWLQGKKPKLEPSQFRKLLCGLCDNAKSVRLVSCNSWAHDLPDPVRDALMESFKKHPPAFMRRESDKQDEKKTNDKKSEPNH